jgi:hypothetical protein
MHEINAAIALGDLLTPETGTWHLDRERSWLAFSIRHPRAVQRPLDRRHRDRHRPR